MIHTRRRSSLPNPSSHASWTDEERWQLWRNLGCTTTPMSTTSTCEWQTRMWLSLQETSKQNNSATRRREVSEVARVFQIVVPSGCTETQCKTGARCTVKSVLLDSPVGDGACFRTWLFGCPACQHNGAVALPQNDFCRRACCTRCRCGHD